jgi:hypothetical protein
MFTINSTRIDNETLTTNVTFIMKDGTPVTCDVAHFMPQSSDEVFKSLTNREASEIVKYEVEPVIKTIKTEIDGMDKEAVAARFESVKLAKG